MAWKRRWKNLFNWNLILEIIINIYDAISPLTPLMLTIKANHGDATLQFQLEHTKKMRTSTTSIILFLVLAISHSTFSDEQSSVAAEQSSVAAEQSSEATEQSNVAAEQSPEATEQSSAAGEQSSEPAEENAEIDPMYYYYKDTWDRGLMRFIANQTAELLKVF